VTDEAAVDRDFPNSTSEHAVKPNLSDWDLLLCAVTEGVDFILTNMLTLYLTLIQIQY
jgi:hypothetical protein